MKTVVLIISLAYIFEYNTEAYTPVDLLGSLDSQIKNMTILINIIKKTYADDPYNHPPPRHYLATLDKAQWALDDARNIFVRPKSVRKDGMYRTRLERERKNPRRPLKEYPRWRPKASRSFQVIGDREESIINPPLWAGEKWANRRSIGGGWLPKKRYPHDSTERIDDDREWNARFYKALSKVLKKELREEPLVSERVGEGYEPAPVYNRKGRYYY